LISLDELESYLRLAIAHARFMGIEHVSPGRFDYYRTFGSERFEVEKVSAPMIGSLYDDFAELKKLSSESSQISCVDLDRLAELLHLLSDSISDA
jgi:hypothetical protein